MCCNNGRATEFYNDVMPPRFELNSRESASVCETFGKLKQAYGEHIYYQERGVFRYRHKSFSEGREHVVDEPRSGRPNATRRLPSRNFRPPKASLFFSCSPDLSPSEFFLFPKLKNIFVKERRLSGTLENV